MARAPAPITARAAPCTSPIQHWNVGRQPFRRHGRHARRGGCAIAKVRASGEIVATVFGDGASSQGAVHEAMNLAAICGLPVLFVCENNRYTDGAQASKQGKRSPR